ncbi:hypothetical protein SARC_16591, partial [Sphaeroforma arctica JP610]
MLKRREFQTNFKANEGNALQACVASILDKPLSDVPNFIQCSDYWEAMLAHAKKHELTLLK